jgi:hypothetical protein
MGNRMVLLLALAACFACTLAAADGPRVVRRAARETLTAVELDRGDTLAFTLRGGQTRTLVLEETKAEILLTNVPELKKGFPGGGTIYTFTCRVRVDGHPMTIERYVSVQQSYYEPHVVNGMRIWFDGVRGVGELFNENHGACVPEREARFAVQDATLPICPQELRPWYPNGSNRLDVHEAYNGDDVWMGHYFGADLHGGLDVNMPIGTPLWAPIDFDDQFFFNSLELGHNNNRWRGVRRWPGGDLWTLQAHHIVRLLVPEHEPLRRGTHYAVAAGVLTGSHAHSHFVFKVGEEEYQILLDPWILFWQIFENNKRRAAAIRAEMAPLEPATTQRPVAFHSRSTPGATGNVLSHYWSFGDGGWAAGPDVSYRFTEPGIYPVTLVVDDGVERAAITQHVTVDGERVDAPSLVLFAPDEVTFRPRPVHAMDVYGRPVRRVPHTLEFVARPRSRPGPATKRVVLRNRGTGTLGEAAVTVVYEENPGWLSVARDGSGNEQELTIAVDASRLKPRAGLYHAVVTVGCPGAVNSPQGFRVELTTPAHRPASTAVVDDLDPECYATPWFWLAPRLHGWPEGFRESYLTSAGRSVEGEFVRFTPDLAAGKYEVAFAAETPFRPTPLVDAEIRFPVRVRHRDGFDTIQAEPSTARTIGTFAFDEGTDGYVEIHAGKAHGPVVADAIRFRRLAD